MARKRYQAMASKRKTRSNRSTAHPATQPYRELDFLPEPLRARAAALSCKDQDLLAYICCYSTRTNLRLRTFSGSHPPSFSCDCTGCYNDRVDCWLGSKDYVLINNIIDDFEAFLGRKSKKPAAAVASEPDGTRGKPGEAKAEEEEETKNEQSAGDGDRNGSGVVLGGESEERVAAVSSEGNESEAKCEESSSLVRKILRGLRWFWFWSSLF